ncbi:MAG: hypothetical protein MN733_34515 [Nitrososphaera sp.]|nr:hypothetical protein [Nitrososphaera sp.]
MSAGKKNKQSRSHSHGADGDDLAVHKVTGKELSELEELSARLTTLVEILDEKGIINGKEYSRMVAMRLHEISKAGAFEELDEEL